MRDPVWEYGDALGKSVAGGRVYRGSRLAELEGLYVYGDAVSGRVWALKYDEKAQRVTANRPLKDRGVPVLAVGEDEKGELYLLTAAAGGKAIYGLARPGKRK